MPVNYTCLSCKQTFSNAWKQPVHPAKCNKCGKTEAWPEEEARQKLSALVPSKLTPVLEKGGTPPPNIGDFKNEIVSRIFGMLDEKGLGFVSMVCRKWRALAKPLLSMFLEDASGFGSGTVVLKSRIQDYLKGANTLDLAVDQFPDPGRGFKGSILGYILEHNIQLNLSLGTENKQLLTRLRKAHQNVDLISSFHKMHNKIWVIDNDGVIVGSPNVSFSGLEGGNIESCVYIKSEKLGGLYRKYLQLLKEHAPQTSLAWKEVEGALQTYNKQSSRMQVAFAPIVNISDFVVQQLAGATKIIIRQFLISSKQDSGSGADILSVLCQMALDGVEIEIYIDEAAYNQMGFVQSAAKRLVNCGCKVYTQKPVTVVNTGGEKIQHDKLILAELHNGVCRTLIGSAGFTKDVIANTNAENFLSIDVKSVYDDLMAHHRSTLKSSYATTSAVGGKRIY